MEAVMLPLYGAPLWATLSNATKVRNLANKINNNLMAIYTLGTFKSTPVEWHKLNSPVKGTEQMIKTTSFNFFARKIICKRRDTKIQDLLAARGLCQEGWRAPMWRRSIFTHQGRGHWENKPADKLVKI
ncbi:hypothetical protein VP01_1821g1 [Puccinia sorghi]|uniref:Uncharacterized protein n=1 Tax=Puccinia sorghi TaxID=27349 RepID=A0A0L6VEL2_9BASI|nr:hypothetical protein VP01_1821g1 [Puccinia sorghi]